MQNLLGVTIFDIDPERLSSAMIPLIPHKRLVRFDVQLDANQGARDGLDIGLELKSWQLMDLI